MTTTTTIALPYTPSYAYTDSGLWRVLSSQAMQMVAAYLCDAGDGGALTAPQAGGSSAGAAVTSSFARASERSGVRWKESAARSRRRSTRSSLGRAMTSAPPSPSLAQAGEQ